MERTFYMITLGCPKNRVDAEVIWATAAESGLMAVDDPAEADIIVVNTCAFIQTAVQESIDTIVEAGKFKQEGRCSMLVVAGCLSARHGQELVAELPEVDLFVGPAEAGDLAAILQGDRPSGKTSIRQGASFLPRARTPRANSLSSGAAYVKVAEGCSRSCSFCIIPRLRGPQRSRPVEDLVSEAEGLVRLGVREVVLVAQDLASYGSDLKNRPDLADLLQALCGLDGLDWIRLMYLFPSRMDERLIRTVADQPKVLDYLDLPFQHADASVLKRMKRGGDPETSLSLVDRLRAEIPGVVLRTSLMTGFPGETEAAYQELVRLVDRCRFERLGVFAFSPEEGSLAAVLGEQVPEEVAGQRRDSLLARQQEIALAYHQGLVGSVLPVLVEGLEQGRPFGRAWNQAPEVDGTTLLSGAASIGQMVQARVTAAGPYDLEAEIVED